MFGRKRRVSNHTAAEIEAEEYNRRQEKYDDELKKVKQKMGFKNRLSQLKFPTYTKNLVAIIIFICLVDLQLTYVLAFLNKMTIAEELSKQLCTTILGVAFVYMVRAYFDSKAEHDNDKPSREQLSLKKELDKMVNSKVSAVVNDVMANLGVETPLSNFMAESQTATEESEDESETSEFDNMPVDDEIPDEVGWRLDPNQIPVETVDLGSTDPARPLSSQTNGSRIVVK